MPNYVAIVRFSQDRTDKLLRLREKLAAAGYAAALPAWPPHITVAAYEEIDEARLCAWAEEYAAAHAQFDVALSTLSILPPGGEHRDTAVLCLAPASSKPLIDFYYGFHERFDEYCGKLGYFYTAKFGYPAIHSTVGVFHVKTVQNALEIILAEGIFGVTRITALEIYTYPMRLIKSFGLRDIK